MSTQLSAINLITLDLIYSKLPRIPNMGEEVWTDEFRVSLGGGPVAALATAARLGAPARLATSLSDDYISRIAGELLKEEGLEFRSFCAKSGKASPVNVSSVMTFENQDRSFVSYFPNTDFYTANTEEIYQYIEGSEYCIASYPSEELFQRLKANGCRIIYDVGWDDALSLDSLEHVLKMVYLFSPNNKEAQKLTGATDTESALRKLAEYVEQPIVKMDKDGSLVWKHGEAVWVPPIEFSPIDSTGAGDAFLGGVAYGLLQGWDIVRCVQMGNYTGGKATTAIGCLTARSSLEEFEALCQTK